MTVVVQRAELKLERNPAAVLTGLGDHVVANLAAEVVRAALLEVGQEGDGALAECAPGGTASARSNTGAAAYADPS